MCFVVLKVVRSPRFDHGHDEESRDGRDIRFIYWKVIFGHRNGSGVIRVFFGVPGGYLNALLPGEVVGLHGP